MIKVYHNPRCKKSRAGLQYVQEHTDDFEIVEYLKNPIDVGELNNLLIKLNKNLVILFELRKLSINLTLRERILLTKNG